MSRGLALARLSVLAAAATLVLVVVAAGAEGDDEGAAGLAPGAGGEAAPCRPEEPCTLINGYASPGANGESPTLVSFAEAVRDARPASACPAIARGYATAGIELDGVIGPCPRGVDPSQARAAATHAAGLGLGLGGRR